MLASAAGNVSCGVELACRRQRDALGELELPAGALQRVAKRDLAARVELASEEREAVEARRVEHGGRLLGAR